MHFVATGDYKINCGMTNMGKKTFETQNRRKTLTEHRERDLLT